MGVVTPTNEEMPKLITVKNLKQNLEQVWKYDQKYNNSAKILWHFRESDLNAPEQNSLSYGDGVRPFLMSLLHSGSPQLETTRSLVWSL